MQPNQELPTGCRWLAPRGDSPILAVENRHARAEIALLGGHVLRYRPAASDEALFVSETARYEVGGSIRGGIPICWPWFGDSPRPGEPAHGFVRTRLWSLDRVTPLEDGAIEVALTLKSDDETRAIWAHDFELTLVATIGFPLAVTLHVANRGDAPFTYGGALHTYLAVSDVSQVTLDGLDGLDYLDKVRGMTRHSHQGPLHIADEVDRVFLDTEGPILVDDPAGERRLVIRRQQSRTAVVWNPGPEKGASMKDLSDHQTMLCVESAQAFDDVRTVAPGETTTLGTTIAVEALTGGDAG